jgi:MFS family permease
MSVVIHNVLTMSTLRDNELLPSRPTREAVLEIVGMGVFGLLSLFVLPMLPSGSEGFSRMMGLAPTAGAVVIEHIGWAFGAYIPILLGFYAIVIGRQLIDDPALILIVAACVADPSQAGVLFVIAPVSAAMFFLAIQLGGFIVFERELRLARAERSRNWAKERLRLLRRRSQRPTWLVVAVHTLVGVLIGAATILPFERPTGLLHILALLQALVALGLGFASVGGAHVFFTARDRTSKVVAWIGPATLYLVSLIIAVVLLTTFGAASGASVVSVVVFSAVSALWPRKSAPRFLLNWTLQGAAIRYAARSVSTTYVRSVREVRELAEPQSTEGTPTLRDRAAAALRAFRRNSPHSNA